jgi:hypothetical protein
MSDLRDPRELSSKSRKRRSEAEIISGVDPFAFMCTRLGSYRDKGDVANAERIAEVLMPYVKPKLRSVDLNLSGQVKVTVSIGGVPELQPAQPAVIDATPEPELVPLPRAANG